LIDESNLIELSSTEIKEEEKKFILLSSSKNKQTKLLENIFEFNLQNTYNDFLEFFCEKNKKNCKDEKDKVNLINLLKVRKSRLNSDIKTFNLYVNKHYILYKINVATFLYFEKELRKILKGKLIASLRIFDSFQGENKPLFLNKNSKNFLFNMLAHENRNIQIISILNNEETKNYFKDLLEYHTKHKNKSSLSVKYLRKAFSQSSSMFYALITDTEKNDYIFYYESITNWLVVTPVDKKYTFTIKFNELLESRFEFYFDDKELHKNNEVLDVTLELFKGKFEDKTKLLIDNLEEFITNDLEEIIRRKPTGKVCKNKTIVQYKSDLIKEKINIFIRDLKKIKIAFPNAYYSNMLLFQQIRQIEILSLLKISNNLPNTEIILKQLIESDLIKTIYNEFELEIMGDKYVITNEIELLELTKLRIKLNNTIYYDQKSIIDIHYELFWNTREQIVESLNLILIDDKKISKLIFSFLDKDQYINKKHYKIILRAIFDTYYDIEFSNKLNLTKTDKNALNKIYFNNNIINEKIKEYIE